MSEFHPQDQLLIFEALTYWTYDVYDTDKEFGPSDPRRNRAAELAQELLQSDNLPEGGFEEIMDPE